MSGNIARNQSDSTRRRVGLCATLPVACVFAARFNTLFGQVYVITVKILQKYSK